MEQAKEDMGNSTVFDDVFRKMKNTKEEIFEKKLLAFVPYYLMRYERATGEEKAAFKRPVHRR